MKRPAALLISAAGYSGSTARARSTSGNASTMDNSPDPVCDSAVSAAALRGSIASARRAALIARALSAPNLAEPASCEQCLMLSWASDLHRQEETRVGEWWVRTAKTRCALLHKNKKI